MEMTNIQSAMLLLMILAATSQAQAYRLIYVNVDNPNATDSVSCWDGGPNLPCNTLSFALGGVENSTKIVIARGEYELSDTNSTFRWLSGFIVVGATDESGQLLTVVSCSNPNVGITFFYSNTITFQNIEFSGCGALHNSTSRNFSDPTAFSFLAFQTGMYFLFCKDIAFTNVLVNNSRGIGVTMYAIGGENSFVGCKFSYNRARDITEYPGGGGVYIEFPFCSPEDPAECENGTASIPPEYNSNVGFTFTNSSFSANVADMTHPVEFVYFFPRDTRHLTFGRGGGLSVYFSNINNSSLKVENCIFQGNKAVWGAGVFVEFEGLSRGNNFSMTSSLVRDNECNFDRKSSPTSGGGGVRINYSFLKSSYAGNNHISFYNCTFSGNKAFWGGGLSFSAAHDLDATEVNTLEFVKCTWMANKARIGSAVDLTMWYIRRDSSLVRTRFTNCIFTGNTGHVFRDPVGNLVPLGTMYVDSIPVQFDGVILFHKNNHSAIVVAETSVNFMSNCIANFTDNSGRKGGAIQLLGYAFIRVHSYTHMYFIRNAASEYGGAIYSYAVGEHGIISSFAGCFIQYEDVSVEPWNWTAKFHFVENTATFVGGNNSISAVSLLPCVFGSYGPQKLNYTPFCWSENWYYGGRNCTEEVTSLPSQYIVNGMGLHKVGIIPGKSSPIGLQMKDDLGHNATDQMVLNAWTLSNDADIANSSLYISSNTILMFGQPNTTATINVQTIDPRVVNTEIEVTLLPCPPGLIPQTQEDNLTLCSCGGRYAGNIICSSFGFRALLQRGTWMGYYTKSGKQPQLVVGMCAYTSSQMPNEYFPLPKNGSTLDKELCAPVGRTGVLCGNCIEGYGPAYNSKSYQCVRCTHKQAKYYWIYYILSKYLPITIFFFITLLFNISVTRGPANAFILFAQLLTTTFDIDGDGTMSLQSITSAADTLQAVYTIPYQIWNLDFLTPVLPELCLSPHIDTLTLIALEYLVAFYPLFLILIFYAITSLYDRGVKPIVCLFRPVHKCFATLKRNWNIKRSTVDAFATFLVLSYTKFTVVSVYLLSGVALYDNEGHIVDYVMYYNGNIVSRSRQHIPYLLLAIAVLIVFVLLPPVLLLVYPLKLLMKISPIQVGGRMQMFLDTFQGCYKDGTEGTRDCRYFAGLYFLLRTFLFTLYAYTGEWFRQYTVQQIMCTVGILLFATLRPYKNNNISNLDAIIFGILAIINVLSIYNSFLISLNLTLSTWAFTVQYILIFCPLIYMVMYVIWHIWSLNTIKKLHCCFFGGQRPLLAVSDCDSSSRATTGTSTVDEDFLEYTNIVEACGRDREINTYRPSRTSHLTSPHDVQPESSYLHQPAQLASLQESIGTSEHPHTPLLTPSSTNSSSKGTLLTSGYESIPRTPPNC